MKTPVIPFPETPADWLAEGDEIVRAAAQDLVDAVAAEPVPERLRLLAAELGRALERRRTAPPAAEDGPTRSEGHDG